MKKSRRILAFLMMLVLAVSLYGTALGSYHDDDTNQEMYSYVPMPITLTPAKSELKAGDTAEVSYEFGAKAKDGRAIDHVKGAYQWIYVNEYTNPDGTKDVWEDYADGDDAYGEYTALTGTIKFKVDRSDYSFLKLRIWAWLTDENGEEIFLWPEDERDPDRYATGDQVVSFTITDAVPRKNVTCDFTLPSAPLTYGKSYQVGYTIHGLENAKDLELEIYAASYDKTTNIEPAYTTVHIGSSDLSGTITFNAVYGNYISVHVIPYWKEGDNYCYRSLESKKLAISPISLGTSGWVTKNGKKYYGDSGGNALRGIRYVDGIQYYFDETGAMVTGWFDYNGGKAYADPDGSVRAGYDGSYYDENGNEVYYSSHIQEVDGELYWFNYDSTIATNRVIVDCDNSVYFLDATGKAVEGWVKDDSGRWFYGGKDKKLTLGWATIDGKKYYFNPGATLSEKIISTGYEGVMATGVASIDGKLYKFDENGALVGEITGFVPFRDAADAVGTYEADSIKLILEENGKATIYSLLDGIWYQDDFFSWKLVNGKIHMERKDSEGEIHSDCYLARTSGNILVAFRDADATKPARFYYGAVSVLQGEKALDGWNETAEGWIYVEDGEAATGWKQVGSDWYFFDENGVMTTGWKNSGGTWYYFKDSGEMATGWTYDGSDWYYMNSDGTMATGWLEDGGDWYYIGNSGTMVTGWLESGGSWYFFDDSGEMATGWRKSGGTWYFFDDSGEMATGWRKSGGTWYFFDDSGEMVTGWLESGGSWYYFDGSGAMVTGWRQIGGTWYYFNGGAMVTGWQLISGQWEMFADSGAWLYTWDGE